MSEKLMLRLLMMLAWTLLLLGLLLGGPHTAAEWLAAAGIWIGVPTLMVIVWKARPL